MIYLLDKNVFRILTIFAISPGSRWNRQTLKERAGISNIMLDKMLFKLLNLGILIKKKNFYEVNFNNEGGRELIDQLLKSYNLLKRLPLKIYFEIWDVVLELSNVKNLGNVYLFGSYSKLVYREDSDLDLAIISDNIDKNIVGQIANKYGKKYKKKIEIHFFGKDFYNNKKDPFVKEVLQHGIKIL